MVGMTTCAGCKHNWYSAPGGTDAIKSPHSRCLYFAENIPSVIEKKRGCDGKLSPEWVDSIKPPNCPTFPVPPSKPGCSGGVSGPKVACELGTLLRSPMQPGKQSQPPDNCSKTRFQPLESTAQPT